MAARVARQRGASRQHRTRVSGSGAFGIRADRRSSCGLEGRGGAPRQHRKRVSGTGARGIRVDRDGPSCLGDSARHPAASDARQWRWSAWHPVGSGRSLRAVGAVRAALWTETARAGRWGRGDRLCVARTWPMVCAFLQSEVELSGGRAWREPGWSGGGGRASRQTPARPVPVVLRIRAPAFHLTCDLPGGVGSGFPPLSPGGPEITLTGDFDPNPFDGPI